jgi:hypothetical protein
MNGVGHLPNFSFVTPAWSNEVWNFLAAHPQSP